MSGQYDPVWRFLGAFWTEIVGQMGPGPRGLPWRRLFPPLVDLFPSLFAPFDSTVGPKMGPISPRFPSIFPFLTFLAAQRA